MLSRPPPSRAACSRASAASSAFSFRTSSSSAARLIMLYRPSEQTSQRSPAFRSSVNRSVSIVSSVPTARVM